MIDRYCLYCCLEKGRPGGCEFCGPKAAGAEVEPHPLYLAPGTILENKYLIGRVLGRGGFGVTYLGVDLQLQLRVAIKEHLPHDLASRGTSSPNLTPFSDKDREDYQYGLDKFVEEARTLARFSEHSHIVSVRDFLQANNTAYLVMPYLEGMSLDMHLANRGGRLQEPEAAQILMMILDGLKAIHEASLLHRDVKPQNIFITKDGTVKLIDFGSARTDMGRHSQVLSKIVSDGYSPFEQYITTGREGPWTDIYAAGAVAYHMLSGQKPPMATERAQQDEMPALTELENVSASRSFSDIVGRCMAVESGERYQSADEVLFDLTKGQSGPISASILHFNLPESGLAVRAMQPGTMLSDRYRIIEIIQIDPVGIVYKASDSANQDENVSIRLLPADVASETNFNLLAPAVEAAKLLHHKSIQEVRSIHLDGEDLYIVSEYIEGRNLSTYLDENGPQSSREAVKLGVEIGAALAHAHEKGVHHGALDSLSIIHNDGGKVSVGGFGYEWILRRIVHKATGGKMPLHTLFMPPEQWIEGKTDEQVDCYAMGMVLYECLSGRHPWRDVGDLEQRVQYKVPPPIKDAPRPVMQAIMTAIQKDRNIRYRDAKDFRIRLVKALEHSELTSKPDYKIDDTRIKPDAPQKTWIEGVLKLLKFKWLVTGSIIFVVLFLILTLNWYFNKERNDENVKEGKAIIKKELSDEEIKEQYTELCEKGDGKACYNLASVLFNQEKNWNEAKAYYEKACEGGFMQACSDLGVGFIANGNNWKSAKPKFKLACDGGIKYACLQYALILMQKENMVQEAKKLFLELCETGDPDACTHTALLFWKEGSWISAKPLLIKACEANQKDACRFAGAGLQVAENNWTSAKTYFKKGCDLGNDDSCLFLAWGLYEHGTSWIAVKPELTRLCNANGHLLACGYLGKGILDEEKNFALAKPLLQKSCNAGNRLACLALQLQKYE